MSNKAAAQKAQVPTMTVVAKVNEATAQVVNMKAAAEEVKPIVESKDQQPTPKATTQPTTQQAAEATAQPEQPTPTAEPQRLSIEDIKRKNEKLSRLTKRWDDIAEKRRRVENFAISHDTDSALVTVRDARGEVFESNSPKTIGRLLEFWLKEFETAQEETEQELRELV